MSDKRYGRFEADLEESWETFEPLLKDDMQRLIYRFYHAMNEAAACWSPTIPRKYVDAYFMDRFSELAIYCRDHRESFAAQARRQEKQLKKAAHLPVAYAYRPPKEDKRRVQQI